MTVFTVKLPVALVARVRAHATGSGRSISSVVTLALEQFLPRVLPAARFEHEGVIPEFRS